LRREKITFQVLISRIIGHVVFRQISQWPGNVNQELFPATISEFVESSAHSLLDLLV
jgi:hypothetical protein